MPAAYLEALNEGQRAAVEHGVGDGATPGPPLLVIAGAGSGKTNTLAHRVAHLIVNGADPRRILLMTFSRRAASEMTRRVETIAARALGERAGILAGGLEWAGTFHGIGARMLREYSAQLGLDPSFTIHDREDSADLMNLVRHELGFSQTEKRFPLKGTCLAIYSRCVNAQCDLDDALAQHFPWVSGWSAQLRDLFAAYVEAKQKQNVLDYDDLLLYWAQAAAEPALADDMGARFDHVLVDEYQDTNRLQAAILLALKPDGKGLAVVGDDAQSIYAFRAAEVRNILDFPRSFTPPAKIVTLDRNYRSSGPILAAANGVIGEAKERYAKDLWTDRDAGERPKLVIVRDEADQARYIVERVLEARECGATLKQQAVLFRTSHHSGPLEVELVRRNIPFVKFGGLKFLDSAHVKDLLALLRFAENPRDRVAGFRLMLLVPGVGPGAAVEAGDGPHQGPLPLREPAPDPELLAVDQGVFQAVHPHDTAAADLLGLSRRGAPLGEEEVGIDPEAVGLVLPGAFFGGVGEVLDHLFGLPAFSREGCSALVRWALCWTLRRVTRPVRDVRIAVITTVQLSLITSGLRKGGFKKRETATTDGAFDPPMLWFGRPTRRFGSRRCPPWHLSLDATWPARYGSRRAELALS